VAIAGLPLPQPAGRGRVYATTNVNGEPVRLLARAVGERGRAGGTLVVGQSLAPEQEALASLLVILIVGGGAGLLLSFAGAWFLAGRALVPIARAFRRQQEFVADASHELRTPLTVLRTATDLLDQHRDQPLAANGELFDDVRHEIVRMERLTTDLLTLARSDRGDLHLAVAPVDVGALAGEVVRRTRPLAQARDVALSYGGTEPAPVVEADPDRLEQILLILLDNALRHTPPGGRVGVSVRGQDGEAIVAVADTGVGIAAEHLPRIFERFYRADPSRSPADGGAGLGLAIAKALVDAHGGKLAVQSAPGAGTRITIRLRSELPRGAPTVLPASAKVSGSV
jgi:signal transduction histidine kinase